MSREVIEQLKSIRHEAVNPRPQWLAKNRALLLSQIKNTISSETRLTFTERAWAALSIFLPRTVVYNVVRPIAVVLVIIVAATSAYSGTVKASYETLPGDTLYPVKLLAEKIPVTVASLTGDNNTEVKLHIKIAKNRLEETKKILTGSDPRKKDQLGVTMTNLKNELKTVNDTLNDAKANPVDIRAESVKNVSQGTEQIKSELQDFKINLLASASQEDKALSKEISETKDLVNDVSVKAVEVMVNKHLEGDQSVSKEDLKEAINTTLQNNLSNVAESKQNVDGAKIIVNNINTGVKDLANVKKSAVSAEAASTTKAFAAKVSTVATETQAASVKTDAASLAADQKAKEVEVLLGQNDLLKAVDKVKEVAQVSKDAEKISDATLEKTQGVVPVAPVIKGVSSDTIVSTTLIFSTSSKDAGQPITVSTTIINITRTSTGTTFVSRTTTATTAETTKK